MYNTMPYGNKRLYHISYNNTLDPKPIEKFIFGASKSFMLLYSQISPTLFKEYLIHKK